MRESYVLHIPKWYPNINDQLDAIFIQRHIESTHSHYDSVVIYAKSSSSTINGILYEIHEEFDTANYTIKGYYKSKYTGIGIIDKLIKAVIYFYLILKFYKKAVKKCGHPLLVHAHVLLRTGCIAYLISKIYKLPYVITEHSTFYTSLDRKQSFIIKNLIRRIIVQKASAIITVSANLEKGMKKLKLYNENYYRIFNSVNKIIFCYKTKVPGLTYNILHVSEFKNDHKNILGLLHVIKRLYENKLNFTFHLVGYGRDLRIIQQYITSHKLQECIIMHGKKTGIELATLYNLADVFVLFSNKENMPCVIAESLCCGTPVISTDVGGISEIIDTSNGMLVEKGNENDLYLAILNFIEGRQMFNSESISRKALNLFSNESIGLAMKQVYQDSLVKNTLG